MEVTSPTSFVPACIPSNGGVGLFSTEWTSSGPVRNINMFSSVRYVGDNGGDCVECSNQRADCVLGDFASVRSFLSSR